MKSLCSALSDLDLFLSTFLTQTHDCVDTAAYLPTCRRSSRHLSPQYTVIHRIASRMATGRGVQYNQMFPNACVLLNGLMAVLIVTHYSSPGPPASQSAGRVCVNPFFCVVILVKNNSGTALKSRNPTEDNPLDCPSNALRTLR